jgi:hypothetical protein
MRRLRIAALAGVLAAVSLSGAGTAEAKKRCRHGYVLKRGHCVKKHSRQHQRQGTY